MKEKVYEVRTCGIVICAFNNREDAEEKAYVLNLHYGHGQYYVKEVEKDSLTNTPSRGG